MRFLKKLKQVAIQFRWVGMLGASIWWVCVGIDIAWSAVSPYLGG